MKGQEQNRGRTQNPHAAGPSRGFVPPAAVHNVPQKESQWYNPARQQEPLPAVPLPAPWPASVV